MHTTDHSFHMQHRRLLSCKAWITAQINSNHRKFILLNTHFEHKKNGYLAKPFNINDFSKGIDYCLTKIDKKNLKKFSNKLKVQFGQENINKSYNNLFNSILSKS